MSNLSAHEQKMLARVRQLVKAVNPHMTETEQEAVAQQLFTEWLHAGESVPSEVQG